MKRPWYFKLPERLWGLAESVCISVCASAATFPVLVLRGLSVSIWAVVSSVAVLWLIQPMMLLGLGTAFAGLVPALAPLYGVLSAASAALTGLLDRWAVWIAAKPGAGLYFDTAYAAIVCLVLILLCWLAFRWRLRLRVAVPCIVLTAAVSAGGMPRLPMRGMCRLTASTRFMILTASVTAAAAKTALLPIVRRFP